MKIIFLNRYFYPDYSATSQMLSDVVFHLATKDYAVTVITSRQIYDDPAKSLCADESIDGVRIRRVWTTRFGRTSLVGRFFDYLTFYVFATVMLFYVARCGDIVVAKTDPPLISVPASWVSRLLGARLVNWLQDLFPEVGIQLGVTLLAGKIGRFLIRVRNRSLKRAVVNVAIGERMAGKLVAEGIQSAKIQVIHNWADGDQIDPTKSSQQDSGSLGTLRDQWGLKGKFVVGYSGNLGRAHEVETLLESATVLSSQHDIVFLLIGGGIQKDFLQAEVKRRELKNFMFKPYQPRKNLSNSLGVADIHLIILRPELEGLIVPSKLYGAMAAGKPVLFVGDPQGEVAKIVNDLGVGICTETGDSEDFAEEILRLSRAPELVQQMGITARKDFERLFSKQRAMAEWESAIEAATRD